MADINHTIQKFYSVSQDRGFARDFQFRLLSINLGGGSTTRFDDDDIVYVKSPKLPGRNIANKTVSFMGLQFNMPGTVTYPGSESYNVEFFADAKSIIRDKLEQASREVFDDETSTGNYFMPRADATMEIAQIDEDLNVIRSYTLVGVSIRNINEISGNVAGSGDVMSIAATLSYHYYKTH